MPKRSLTRRESLDATHRNILEHAKKEFLKNGLGGTSIDTVAARAKVSKMTVYRHYKSKSELLRGVVEELLSVPQEWDTIVNGQPLREGLRRYGRHYQSIIFAHDTVQLNRIVIAESQRFKSLSQLYFRSGPQVAIDHLTDFLRPFAEGGQLAIDDPRDAAVEFLDHLRGYPHLRLLMNIGAKPTQAELKTKLERAIERLLKP